MRVVNYWVTTGLLLATALLHAQSTQPAALTVTVPKLVRVSHAYHAADGSVPAGQQSVMFSIYAEETGGAPLWQEVQNVALDRDGNYTLLLGSTHNEGIPVELFASREPRWLGVQFQRAGEVEQSRVRLASVPYALKAADADTLGGRPLSDFVLTEAAVARDGTIASEPATSATTSKAKSPTRKVTSGTTNKIGKFINGTDLGDSAVFENNGLVGIGTTAPLDVLHLRYTNTNGGMTGLAVQNLGNTTGSYSGMLFYDQFGALGQFQGFNNVTHEYRINNIASNASINFMLGSNSKFLVRGDGDIDIAGNVRKAGTLFLHNLGTFSLGVGEGALRLNTAFGNTAAGYNALSNTTTGEQNTAVGRQALLFNATGSGNTAVGLNALLGTTGNGNIGLGNSAGGNIGTGSNNIMIGNQGVGADDKVIRIGSVQTKNFVAGVRTTATDQANAMPVMIDSNGQLGTTGNLDFIPNANGMGTSLSNARISNATINSPQGNHINPNVQFALSATIAISPIPECGSCTEQIIVGIVGPGQVAQGCLFSGVVGVGGINTFSGVSLRAPTVPGTYYVAFDTVTNYPDCASAIQGVAMDSVPLSKYIGAIAVY